MTKKIVAPILLFLFIVSAFHCKKDGHRLSGCLKGQLVDQLCGNIIVKVIEGDYDPSFVVDSWYDPHSGNTYTKFFAVSNPCQVQGRLTNGQEFYFYFTDNPPAQTCFTCDALRATPPKINAIRISPLCN